ncbi:MGH1-like glycoside hydrolase domain-containing protein [Dyadobacter sp. NIV53]|uniref:MGH1-like glycoside hydrolase domain-containing protein n=1 Tax=Dyadobacter sp. NIV53 TaxID=2861765 RepID=UPI001C8786A6|nr:trehalase family glycosidase [Dyadobacter sp. NIV53]
MNKLLTLLLSCLLFNSAASKAVYIKESNPVKASGVYCPNPPTDSIPKRENINGNDVIPILSFPGITQVDFKDAFDVLDECLVMDPGFGFKYPFIAPGGHYGQCWWQLDGSISMNATKWSNQKFSENMVRGFIGVQKPDGRIPLYGYDKVPNFPTCSSLPKFFQSAYNVLKHTDDKELITATYNSLKLYLNWWLSDARRDKETGLITGVFEESFPPFENRLKAVSQVDLNVEVVAGCHDLALLAGQLDLNEDFKKFNELEKELKHSINTYMWDDNTGAFYAYLIHEKKRDDKLICYTFDPFRHQTATPEKIQKMLRMLTDNRYFNWEGNAITSVAKTDKIYVETVGDYNGNPSWSGDIWTLRNEAVIKGLEDIGRYDLASELALKTVRMFNSNYTEFLKTSDASGQGVKRYAWSAAQYIQILIENIFGVDYNRFTKTITIKPNLNALEDGNIALEKLLLPNGSRLNLYISKKSGSVNVKYKLTGKANDMNIVVALPMNGKAIQSITDGQNKSLKFVKVSQNTANTYQVNHGKKNMGEFNFISEI